MANSYFQFKQFTIHQDQSAMKVTTDGCLFGAWVANELRRQDHPATLLDLGTGTGLLSLMIRQFVPIKVKAVEIDAGAASQASGNFEASPWKADLLVVKDDIRTLPAEKFPCIVSNPPFYENELASGNTSKDLAHHSAALSFEELLKSMERHLEESGEFYLLLPFKRWNSLKDQVLKADFFFKKIVLVHPSTRHSPFRVMVQCSTLITGTEESALYIRNEKNEYTPEFRQLLHPYYLHL